MAQRSIFTIPAAEKQALKEIARRTRRTETEIVVELIRFTARKNGIDLAPSAPPAAAGVAPSAAQTQVQ
jgi:hypothetical protein